MAKRLITYRTKLGTVPYANVVSSVPLLKGERFWVPETSSFKPVKPRYSRPMRWYGWASVLVDKVDGDVLFLTRM